jgi:S-adenosylmethionine-dependent methyltransferase
LDGRGVTRRGQESFVTVVKSDVYFDTIANQFEQDVYGSSKGFIRRNVLWEDLLTELPHLKEGGLSILDAGGGAGRMTLALAKIGHNVTLVEPAKEMLEKAHQLIASEKLSGSVTFVNKSLQDFTSKQPFDVVLNHAVLEWLVNPKEALEQLVKHLKPDGYLSLMFYNRNTALFKHILAGNFSEILLNDQNSFVGSWNEACKPLYPETVISWLEDFGIELKSKSGIRIFHDFIAEKDKEGKLEELLVLEKATRKREPFASLAQHVHVVAQKSS